MVSVYLTLQARFSDILRSQVAVVKGAALRGLEGVAPQKRRCKRHYGIECDYIFREGIDEEQHSFINPYTGDKMCKGRTFWLMAKVSKASTCEDNKADINRAKKSRRTLRKNSLFATFLQPVMLGLLT